LEVSDKNYNQFRKFALKDVFFIKQNNAIGNMKVIEINFAKKNYKKKKLKIMLWIGMFHFNMCCVKEMLSPVIN